MCGRAVPPDASFCLLGLADSPPASAFACPPVSVPGSVTGAGPVHPGRPQLEVTEYTCQDPFSQESHVSTFQVDKDFYGMLFNPLHLPSTLRLALPSRVPQSLPPCPSCLSCAGRRPFVCRCLSSGAGEQERDLDRGGECAGRIPAAPGFRSRAGPGRALGQRGARAGTPTSTVLVCKA